MIHKLKKKILYRYIRKPLKVTKRIILYLRKGKIKFKIFDELLLRVFQSIHILSDDVT